MGELRRRFLEENLFLKLEIIHYLLKSSKNLETSFPLKRYDLIAAIIASWKIYNAAARFTLHFAGWRVFLVILEFFKVCF